MKRKEKRPPGQSMVTVSDSSYLASRSDIIVPGPRGLEPFPARRPTWSELKGWFFFINRFAESVIGATNRADRTGFAAAD